MSKLSPSLSDGIQSDISYYTPLKKKTSKNQPGKDTGQRLTYNDDMKRHQNSILYSATNRKGNVNMMRMWLPIRNLSLNKKI